MSVHSIKNARSSRMPSANCSTADTEAHKKIDRQAYVPVSFKICASVGELISTFEYIDRSLILQQEHRSALLGLNEAWSVCT